MSQELKAYVGIDDSDLIQGLKRSEQRITDFVNKIDNIAAVGQKLQNIGQSLTVGLTLPIVALGGAAVKAYGDMQALEMGLIAVMGSAKLAGGELENLREVAKLPGLGLKEAVKGSVALQSAGFSADMARRALISFGNALATVGKGANELGFVNLALTQIQNKTGGFGQDLRQLTEQLPQLRTAMQEAFGTSNSEDIQNLGYTGAQVVEMLVKEFEKLPKVTGGINNAFENMRDSIFISMSSIGRVIDENFNISGIIDRVSAFITRAVSAFESLNPAIQKSILVVGGLVAAAGPLITALGLVMAALPSIVSGFGLVQFALTKVGGVMGILTNPIALVTAGLIGIVTAVVTNWDKIRPYVEGTINWFRKLYNESALVRGGVETIYLAFSVAFKGISGILKTGWEVIKSFVKLTADAFAGLGDVILGALSLNPDTIAKGLVGINIAVNNGIKSIWGDLRNGFNQVTADFARLGAESVNRFKNGISSTPIILATVKENIKAETEDAVVNGVTQGVEAGTAKLGTVQIELPDLEVVQGEGPKGFMDNLGNEFANFWDIDTITGKLDKDMRSVGEVVTMGLSNIQLGASSKFSEIWETFNQGFNNLLQDALPDAFFDLFASIGEAIGSGGNVLNAMGKSVLSSLGQFLSQLGKQFVIYGTAVALFGKAQLSLLSPEPFTKIPAGLALAAAGAALAVAGGVIKGIAGGGSRGSYNGSGTFTPDTGVRSYSSSYRANSMGSGEVVLRISGTDLVGVLQRNQYKLDRLS